METFFSLLFFDSEFRYYPATYQAQLMREKLNIEVSDQSLRNWKKILIKLNWIAIDEEDCKYYSCRKNQKPVEIKMGEHKKAWREFYARVGKGENADIVWREIYYKYNGLPRKQRGFAENAIEHDKIQEFRQILSDF